MNAHIGYLAIVSDQPEKLARFYAQYFQMWELGRSDEGDISITDGHLNVSLLKQRPGVEGACGRPGLSHFGVSIDGIREVEARLEEFAPNAEIQPENGDLHHGEYRVFDPNGIAVSLSTTNFGIEGQPARRLPRIRHVTYSVGKGDEVLGYFVNVFGFRELSLSKTRRQQQHPARFAGDGHINLAILPSMAPGAVDTEKFPGWQYVERYRDEDERAINERWGLNHFGFVVGDVEALMNSMPPELSRMTNKRPEIRNMAEYRVFDPDLNAIDLSQLKGYEVDVDVWERA